jgi:endonuclease-8
VPRLRLIFENGEIDLYSCSLKYIESKKAKEEYDFSISIMSPKWDGNKALKQVKSAPESEIADLLLDQSIFAGVGNIIKNEVLSLVQIAPTSTVENLSLSKLKEIVKTAQEFSHQFYKWRKRFVLRKHYKIYKKGICPRCEGKIIRKKTGLRNRVSYFCPQCQK